MIKLILIILIGVLSIVIIKQLRPEYSFLLRIAVLLTVLFSAVAAFSVLSDKIGESIGDAEIPKALCLWLNLPVYRWLPN